jgi:conjugative transfer signal peptidase TraF
MSARSLSRRGTLTARELAGLYAQVAVVTAGVSALACVLASHLLWNWTPSLPRGLYWLSRGEPARLGALVAFPVPDGVRDLVEERKYLPPGALLVKPVVAMDPDRVCTDGGVLTVNGTPLGAVLTRDTAGRPLPHDHVCGPVPEGLVYVASHYAKSFDSRTFGPVPRSDIQGTVMPLWTY